MEKLVEVAESLAEAAEALKEFAGMVETEAPRRSAPRYAAAGDVRAAARDFVGVLGTENRKVLSVGLRSMRPNGTAVSALAAALKADVPYTGRAR